MRLKRSCSTGCSSATFGKTSSCRRRRGRPLPKPQSVLPIRRMQVPSSASPPLEGEYVCGYYSSMYYVWCCVDFEYTIYRTLSCVYECSCLISFMYCFESLCMYLCPTFCEWCYCCLFLQNCFSAGKIQTSLPCDCDHKRCQDSSSCELCCLSALATLLNPVFDSVV